MDTVLEFTFYIHFIVCLKFLVNYYLLCFFFSIFFTLIKYEEQNQTLIFWTNGIKRLTFLNVIIGYSLLFLLLNILFSLLIVPYTQDKARSFIRDSNIDYLPLLIKPKKFIDTVNKLTIYSDNKEENILENIVIKDSFSRTKSKIIYAKSGYFSEVNNDNYLTLNEGKILNINSGKINSFDFNKTQINLSNYTSKTTRTPKLQEVNTKQLLNCFFKPEENNQL